MLKGRRLHGEDLIRAIGDGGLLRLGVVLAQDHGHGLLAQLVRQLHAGVQQLQTHTGGFALIRLNKYPEIFVLSKIHRRCPP